MSYAFSLGESPMLTHLYRAIGISLSFMVSTQAIATNWLVNTGGTGDAPTIQAAIDSSAAEDTISLACGIYFEHNLFVTLPITLMSETGNFDCATIDGQNAGTVLQINATGLTEIKGIRIVNGNSVLGGGIRSDLASLRVLSCYFLDNHATLGGAVIVSGGSLEIRNSTFEGNSGTPIIWAENSAGNVQDCKFITNSGGPAVAFDKTAELRRCQFEENGPFGAVLLKGTNSLIEDCLFLRNHSNGNGGAVSLEALSALVQRCLFVGNTADFGAAIYANRADGSTIDQCTFFENEPGMGLGTIRTYRVDIPLTMSRCIMAYNKNGRPIRCEAGFGISLSCTNIFEQDGGNWGWCTEDLEGIDGNFTADPLFCNTIFDDFTLDVNSPCAPGNHPIGVDCDQVGAFGVGCGTPTAIEFTSWSKLKSMFR